MVKALWGTRIIFGLSEKNIEKLKEGMPIKLNLKDVGLEDRDVIIMYGKTEQDIYKEFKDNGLIDPFKTVIHDKNAEKNN